MWSLLKCCTALVFFVELIYYLNWTGSNLQLVCFDHVYSFLLITIHFQCYVYNPSCLVWSKLWCSHLVRSVIRSNQVHRLYTSASSRFCFFTLFVNSQSLVSGPLAVRTGNEPRILATSAAHRWPKTLLYQSGERPLQDGDTHRGEET